MNNNTRLTIAGIFCACSVLADDPSQLSSMNQSDFQVNAGGDIRARYEIKDNWPSSGKTAIKTDYEEYLRFRTRLWGEIAYQEKYKLSMRVANEFRDYHNSPKNKDKNKFPDEGYVDNLYFDVKNIADSFSLRLGRQDITLGAGRLVKDGTPGDGSRSTYFDAIRGTFNLMEKSTLDVIGTYNHYRDDATIGNGHDVYDLTKIKSGSPYSQMDEMGLIAYLTYNEVENFPMEFYYIWKQETRFYDTLDRYPGRNFHTLGTRLNPKFNKQLSGELEAAVQAGSVDSQSDRPSRDIMAWMTYAGLTYADKTLAGKPTGTLALLYLSGDEDSYYKTIEGNTDNGWNPVFNRTSWFSEIASGMYDKGRWSNLIYPHLQAQFEPYRKHKVKIQTGPMFAAKKDNGANDLDRGYFSQVKYEFPLISTFRNKHGSLKGAITAEMLHYGDYYEHNLADNHANAAYWLRFEIKSTF